MKTVIKLIPVRMDGATQLIIDVEDLVIYVNGEEFDFSPMGVGDMLPEAAIDHALFSGNVYRTAEGLEFELTFPLGPNAPEEARFPQPLVITENGPVDVPKYVGEEPEPITIQPEEPNEDRLQPETNSGELASASLEEILRLADPTPPAGVPSGE